MNKIKILNAKIIPALLSVIIFVSFFTPTALTEESEYYYWEKIIYIDSTKEFLDFAQKCTLDTYSKDKVFILECDINLCGEDFTSIPLFSGTFDGQGHTISGLSIKDDVSITGLFCYVLEDAVVKELNVDGIVEPSGSQFNVGGIAGENNGTIVKSSFNGIVCADYNVGGISGINYGEIIDCKSSGVISSNQCTGGIAGQNTGTISGCTNNASVNTSVNDEQTDLAELESTLLDPKTTETSSDINDTGGIAGYSTGEIINCINKGKVGYDHIGYNVGGIVGRSQGYVKACYNTEIIKGRKDVGGIAGQMEPLFFLQYLENNISKMKDELDTLNVLIGDTVDSASYAASAASSGLESSLDYLEQAQGAAVNMASEMGNWIDSASNVLNNGTWDFENGGIPNIPQLSSDYYNSAAELTSSIDGLNTELNSVIDNLSGAAGQLTYNLKEINDQQDVINHLAADIDQDTQTLINDLEDDAISVLYNDISEDNIFTSGPGHILSCYNTGAVNGDINTGGIIGAIAVESDIDPEDDITQNGERTSSFQYQSIAVIRSCTNYGEITNTKKCAGGIVGRMDTGIIYDSNGFGRVESTSGDYVGGIVGFSDSNVRKCNAKCRLQGLKYVGGIAGSSATIADCNAMIYIDSYEQFAGAISGDVEGIFSNNYFTPTNSEEGIDRFSYSNQAEPLTYSELIKIDDIPSEFKRFTLTFIADDTVIDTIVFNYGDSIDADSIPEVLENDDYYGYWSRDNYDNMIFDETVELIYTRYIAELTTNQTREDGRPIMLIDGKFKDDTQTEIIEMDTALIDMDDAIEYWVLEFTDNGSINHTVRYLPPLKQKNDIEVIILKDGKWKNVPADKMGSYYLFEIEGNSTEIIIVQKSNNMLIYIIPGAVVALVFGILIIKRRKNKKVLSNKS